MIDSKAEKFNSVSHVAGETSHYDARTHGTPSHGSIAFRAGRGVACPVCGASTKGCSATSDGLHLCRGTPGPGWASLGERDGWGLFRAEGEPRRQFTPRTSHTTAGTTTGTATPNRPARAGKDFAALMREFAGGFGGTARAELAAALKLPAEVFDALPIGVTGRDGSGYSFGLGERDGSGTVIGIGTRAPDGAKKALSGSRRGLSIPAGWCERPGPVYIVEGPSDTLAMTAAGLSAIGRPSNNGGTAHLADLLADLPGDRGIVLVGERDEKPDGTWPGRDGALAVARKLARALGRTVSVALPPASVKDVRAWVTAPARTGSWAERGAELAALLAATAETVTPPARRAEVEPKGSYDDLAADELAALKATPAPEVEPCPFTARDDIREALEVRPCPRPYLQTIYRRSTGTHAVADFRCGSPTCTECAREKCRYLFDVSADWLIDVSSEDDSNARYALFVAVVGDGEQETLRKAVSYLKGHHCWLRFAPDVTDERAPNLIRHLSPIQEQAQGSKCRMLFVAALPLGKDAPEGLMQVSATEAMRLMHDAMSNPPARPEGAKRYRLAAHSRAWGYPPERPRSDIELRSRSMFAAREVRAMAAELGITSGFSAESDKLNSPPAGWRTGSQVHDAIFARLLSGIGAPRTPTSERVVDLASDWFRAIPADIPLTPCVAEALKKLLDAHLWYTPTLVVPRIVAELRAAEQADHEMSTEASSMLALLAERYPDPTTAPPFIRSLLA